MVGYHTLGSSALSYQIGARGRLPGLLAGAICAVPLVARVAALFPVPIVGGLLLFLGLGFLVDWLVKGWYRLSKPEYAVVLLILIVIAEAGFLADVAVGLLSMVILFIVSYSRINVVHHAGTGVELRRNVERCAHHRRALADDLGLHTYVLESQGFLFFGTGNTFLRAMSVCASFPIWNMDWSGVRTDFWMLRPSRSCPCP